MYNPFVRFMVSLPGRRIQVAAGAVLIAWGLFGLRGAAGTVISVLGLVPFLAGLFDVCVLGPLFRAPFRGRKIRGEG